MEFIILQQVIIMFLLGGVGIVMFRTGKISAEGSKSISNILIFLSLPCVIIKGFFVECTKERVIGLLISSLLSLLTLVLSMILSHIFCRKNATDEFAAAFSNAGFFGIPLVVASLSDSAVFYVASYIAFLNLFQWSYGVSLLLKEKKDKGIISKTSFREILVKLVKAPFMIAIIIGIFFFVTSIHIPILISKSITFIADLNTPLAMFATGIYLAQTDLKKMFLKIRLYKVCAVRLIIVPLATLFVLCLVPNTWLEMKSAILIAAVCPVGSNVAIYAHLYDSDYTYAVETVVISTLLSIITLPIMMSAANILWLRFRVMF